MAFTRPRQEQRHRDDLYSGYRGSPRGGQCATRFEQLNDALIVAVRDCSAEQWRLPCPNDGRSVGAVAQHVAEVYPAFAHILATLQRGEQYSPSASMEDVDRENAAQAHAAATVERAETLTLLREGGAKVVALLRSLADEQLDRLAGNFGGNELSVAQVVEYVVIGHSVEHLSGIRAALGG